jgi:hypothetical protein
MGIHNFLHEGRHPDRWNVHSEKFLLLSADHPVDRQSDANKNYYADAPFLVTADQLDGMKRIINAVEYVIKSRPFRNRIAQKSGAPENFNPRISGVLNSYDFHLHDGKPKLIEINTNAGGIMFCRELLKNGWRDNNHIGANYNHRNEPLDKKLVAMFRSEWSKVNKSRALRRIAIVDTLPREQFLYPEFEMFKALLIDHGIDTVIAAPEELSFSTGTLLFRNLAVDLVYNRLTDFFLNEPASNAIRQAYESNTAVVTPNPYCYSLYADKINLTLLSDIQLLNDWDMPASVVSTLDCGIPKTFQVTPENTSFFWKNRRQYFFKPTTGFGSKAAYRGAKITKKTWQLISSGGYVAQQYIKPSEQLVFRTNSAIHSYKVDIRNYVFEGDVLHTAARLFQGQTTNFRTPGGGFARVIVTQRKCLTNV